MTPIKTVFHVHTNYSDDCSNSVEQLVEHARAAGVGCMAVADHDTIAGARALAAAAGPELKVLIGQEVTTTGGHLIGLFLREEIEPGMSPRRTAEAIKSQGGLVIVPHPFNRIFGCGLRRHLDELLDLIDVVEVCNSQNLSPLPNRQAERFAEYFGYPTVVGVDLHHGENLDACYQWMEPFDTPAEFVAALKRATFAKGRHGLSYFIRTAWYVLCDRTGLGVPRRVGLNCSRRRRGLDPAAAPASAK